MIPEKFSERMKNILGNEYEGFSAALERESVKGIRVNKDKISVDRFLELNSFDLEALPYANDGFILKNPDGIGTTAEHHSGMIYVQDPGAMATVNALEVKRGWRVLDACAAPGGKSSQLAEKIGEEGLLISNEYVPKRAKIIVSNFERLGIKNALVLSQDTAKFKEMFANYFDLVLCDAPCSGEGMFRKYDEALTEWSEENVISSAKRQREILLNLAPLVKENGYLLYSTCTYSKEENEENIAYFLKERKDFTPVPAIEAIQAVTAEGIPTDGLSDEERKTCRRFYPHLSEGEGQFIALLQRKSADKAEILYKDQSLPLTKQEESEVKKFITECLGYMPDGRLIRQGDLAVLVTHNCPVPKYSVFMAGVAIGEIKKGRIEPHHQFFSAYGKEFKNKENLSKGDQRLSSYLKGEEIEAKTAAAGYLAVLYEGAPIGGGKASSGRIKNHYPKGLRTKG